MKKPKIKGIICIVLLLHVANICRYQYQAIQWDEHDRLACGYYYITNPQSGISTWNTEELWNNNMSQLASVNVATIEGLSNLPSADDIKLKEMISTLPDVPWDSTLRPEIVAEINNLHVTNTVLSYKWEMVLTKGNVQEINDLIDRAKRYPSIPSSK